MESDKKSDYQAVLTCRRCGDKVYVHKWSERITYWYCHRKDRHTRCGTFNVWK
jgi:hypothetical protein